MDDADFFKRMTERYTEKTADRAVDNRPRAGEPDKRGLNPMLVLAPAAAQAFDAYSTRQAMKAGGHEGNQFMEPFADNPAALYGSKIGSGLLIGFLADRLAKSGHRTAAKIVSGVSIALPIGAGIHNMEQAKR
jgi:hypothetical protein